MKIGYGRVSKEEQSQTLKLTRTLKYGYKRIFSEAGPGTGKCQPAFEKMMEVVNRGGELVVWDIDCSKCTTLEPILLLNRITQRDIQLKSISQPLPDTIAPAGEVLFQVFSILADHQQITPASTHAGRTTSSQGHREKGRPAKRTFRALSKNSSPGSDSLPGRTQHKGGIIGFSMPSTVYKYSFLPATRYSPGYYVGPSNKPELTFLPGKRMTSR